MALTGDTGNGATLLFTPAGTVSMGFGASSASMVCTTITQGEQSVGVIDVSTLATTDCMESIPSDLRDVAEYSASFKWLTTTAATVACQASLPAAAGTILLTYPTRTGETTAATITGTGFITGITPPSFANGELQMGEIKWKYDGDTGPTFSGSA